MTTDLWEPPEEPDWGAVTANGWRGLEHPEDWPEELAGPEYWLYKREVGTEGEE